MLDVRCKVLLGLFYEVLIGWTYGEGSFTVFFLCGESVCWILGMCFCISCGKFRCVGYVVLRDVVLVL